MPLTPAAAQRLKYLLADAEDLAELRRKQVIVEKTRAEAEMQRANQEEERARLEAERAEAETVRADQEAETATRETARAVELRIRYDQLITDLQLILDNTNIDDVSKVILIRERVGGTR